MRKIKKNLDTNFSEIGGVQEIAIYIQEKEKELSALFDKKEKQLLKKKLS